MSDEGEHKGVASTSESSREEKKLAKIEESEKKKRKERESERRDTASGGASERVPAPMAPFFVIPFKSSCFGSDLSIISDMRADLG
ncbi:hypothetical protein YC2023_071498 [Brassica napus]